jgi:hypothetical protein
MNHQPTYEELIQERARLEREWEANDSAGQSNFNVTKRLEVIDDDIRLALRRKRGLRAATESD